MSGKRRSARRDGFHPMRYSARPQQKREYTVPKQSRIGHDQLRLFYQQHKATNDGPSRIGVHEITTAIDSLSLHQNLTISEALKDEKLRESYEIIQTAAAKFYGTPHYQALIIDPLGSKTVITVDPGTIGQFLFGGTRKEYGDTIFECSPIGIGAIPPANHPALGKPPVCPRQVWYYRKDKYHRLTNDITRANIADVYVPISFYGLTDSQIERLKKSGINKVNIYTLIKDENSGKETSIKRTDTISIDETKTDKIGPHLIKENEVIITRYQFNNFRDQLVSAAEELIKSNSHQGNERFNFDPSHQWVWAVLILFFIIIVVWVGYNIKNKK